MCDDFDAMIIGLAGALAEEMSEQEQERRRLEKEMEQEGECPCCSKDCDDFELPDEDPCP